MSSMLQYTGAMNYLVTKAVAAENDSMRLSHTVINSSDAPPHFADHSMQPRLQPASTVVPKKGCAFVKE